MAVLIAAASGNFTSASTWQVADTTSALNSTSAENSAHAITTALSGTRSSAFTPGAITIDAILVKLNVRTGTTGTVKVQLETDAGDILVSGTDVTINCSDLPAAVAADINGGWICFKFSSPVTLITATAYQVAAVTSSASQVSLWRDSTAGNISRLLRTTTTQAPVAGDDLIITGERTGAGTGNTITVTMNETTTTDYGAASTSTVTPALAICDRGVLTCGVVAATAYNLKLSGHLVIYAGGICNFGTSGAPMPVGSSVTVLFDCVMNVDFGTEVRNLGTLRCYGSKAFTSSPANHFTRIQASTVIGTDTTSINSLVSASGTTVTWLEGPKFDTAWTGTITINGTTYTISSVPSPISLITIATVSPAPVATLAGSFAKTGSGLGAAPVRIVKVDDTTGWVAGDKVVLTPSSNRMLDTELHTISSVDSATQITVSADIAGYHSGLDDTSGTGAQGDLRAEVINLTRNVFITGVSATVQTYMLCQPTSVVAFELAEFKWFGSGTTNKRGITITATTGTFTMNLCSVHDCVVASSLAVYVVSGTNSSTISITKNVFYNYHTAAVYVVASTGVTSIDACCFCFNTTGSSNNQAIYLGDNGASVTNNYISASGSAAGVCAAIVYAESAPIGTCSGNRARSCSNFITGYQIRITGVIDSCYAQRIDSVSFNFSFAAQGLLISNTKIYAATTTSSGTSVPTVSGITYHNCDINSGVNQRSNYLITIGTSIPSSVTFRLCRIGTLSELGVSNTIITYLGTAKDILLFDRCTFGTLSESYLWTSFSNNSANANSYYSYDFQVVSLRHNGVAGDNRIIKFGGRQSTGATIVTDTVRYATASPSIAIYPGLASVRIKSPTFRAAVANGNTLTPSIKIRESIAGDGAAYNGTTVRPKLYVAANAAAGIYADTLLATASAPSSSGAWDTLTGTTPAVTDDCVLEFYVDLTGTAGWINLDDFACVSPDAQGLKFWSGPLAGPFACGMPAAGGGSTQFASGFIL